MNTRPSPSAAPPIPSRTRGLPTDSTRSRHVPRLQHLTQHVQAAFRPLPLAFTLLAGVTLLLGLLHFAAAQN
ncbi:MAG: hypothetical protein ACFCU3_02655, partial [Verrucomicrobiales bacterium]